MIKRERALGGRILGFMNHTDDSRSHRHGRDCTKYVKEKGKQSRKNTNTSGQTNGREYTKKMEKTERSRKEARKGWCWKI